MKFQLDNSSQRSLPQHLFSIHGLKIFLLGLVRTGSKRHLPLDHRDISVAQAVFIAGIDEGSLADSRSVGQIASRHIGSGPDVSVVVARGVVSERTDSAGGVEVPRGVAKERIDAARGVVIARGVATGSALTPLAVFALPVVLLNSASTPLAVSNASRGV